MFQAVYLKGNYFHRSWLSNKQSFNHIRFTHSLSRESYKQNRIFDISMAKVNYNMRNNWDLHSMLDTKCNQDLHLFRSLRLIYNRIKKDKIIR